MKTDRHEVADVPKVAPSAVGSRLSTEQQTLADGQEPRADSRSARRPLFYIKVVVSLGLLAFIIATANIREVGLALREANFLLIILAAALNPIGGTLTATRWRALLRSQGVEPPLARLIQSCIVAHFFRQFLPSTIGGDAIRIYDSWKMGASKSVAVSTLAVDRIFGLAVLLMFAVVAILLSPRMLPDLPLLPLWVAAGAGGLTGIILLIFLPTSALARPVVRVMMRSPAPVQKAFTKITGSLSGFRGRPGLMFQALGLSVLLQLNVVFFYYLIGSGLGFEVPLLAYFIIVPLATVVMMIPITINAIGLREGIFVLLLAPFGVSMAEAVAFAWLEYGLMLFYGMIGGIIYAVRR